MSVGLIVSDASSHTDGVVIVIASLTARANAIKMLHARIQLIQSYLESLPPSYLTTTDSSTPSQDSSTYPSCEPDYPLLRSIQALLSRLPLLLPSSDLSGFNHEALAEKSDVSLVSLLGSVGQGVKDARELGRKFSVIEHGKNSAKKPIYSGLPEGGYVDANTQEALAIEAATRNSLL